MNRTISALIALWLCLGASVAWSEPPPAELGMTDLIEEMISLDWLGRAAPAGTAMVQFSSYDRASRVEDGETSGLKDPNKAPNPASASEALGWWANRDVGNYLREETTPRGVEWVMAEAEGPGAIVRLWSANPGGRTWRIYLDGADQPTIEARGADLLGGRVKPFGQAFAGKRSLGANLYFPIPFAKSVKVTVAKKTGKGGVPPLMYYHVDVRLYPEGTVVRPFFWEELGELEPEIAAAEAVLLDPDGELVPEGEERAAEFSLAPGEAGELFAFAGPGTMKLFELEVLGDAAALTEALGKTVLTMEWDGQGPAVRAPLGDFFGSSPGVNDMNSLPLSMKKSVGGATLKCRWVMPFKTAARIALQNQSAARLSLRARTVVSAESFGDDALYFHADWRETNTLPTRPFHDPRALSVKGRGRFVGLEMNVRNPMEYFWWGEGDEKVWVDDDAFPSIFGTGTEDYFGYAWCVQYFKFIHAYHGVSLPTREWLAIPQFASFPYVWEWASNASAREAIVSQYRWQILDSVPFDDRIAFDMEIWHHRETTVDVSFMSYWYAAPGATDDGEAEDLAARELWKK